MAAFSAIKTVRRLWSDMIPRKDLAPRDIVARAIDNEMKRTGTEHVYLDCRHLDKEKFLHHFPNIYEKCKSIGIDVMHNMIPVAPAAHYSCGGIKTDECARTSIVEFICGRWMRSTGLHAGQTALRATTCWKRWYLDTVHFWTLYEVRENPIFSPTTGSIISPIGCKGHNRPQRDDSYHTKPERIAADYERLCWYRSHRCAFEPRHETSRFAAWGNGTVIPGYKSFSAVMWAEKHHNRWIPDCERRRIQKRKGLTLQYRPSAKSSLLQNVVL